MPRALIIDDEVELLDLYKTYQEQAGFSVDACAEGLDGFLDSISEKFDLIISDLNMPIISGQELLLEIRDGINNLTPIIVVSGFVDEKVRSEMCGLGHIYFVDKPIDKDQLLSAVKDILSKESNS